MSEHTSGTTPGIHVQHVGTIESVSVDAAGVDRLKPNAIGLMGVIFVAVTGAAPISAMLFNVPISVGYGNGIGTPAAFLRRDHRPHDLLGRLRRDGTPHPRRRRLLQLHLARPRP